VIYICVKFCTSSCLTVVANSGRFAAFRILTSLQGAKTFVEHMASEGNTHQYAADEVANMRQDENELQADDTRLAVERGNSKRKNPFGSLLSLAWKLWETEQKRCKLAGGSTKSTSSSSFSVADMFRARASALASYDRPTFAPFQPSTNVGCENFQTPAVLPVPVTAKIYNDFGNSLMCNVRPYADGYTRCTSYSPDVSRNSSTVASSTADKDFLNTVGTPRTLPQWGDDTVTSFENDSMQDEELHLSERRKHQCHMCSYQTDNRSHMLRHQATAHDACKLYHCYICKMDFSRSERAKSHFLSIHPEIPYHSKMIRKRPHDMVGQGTPTVDARLTGREHEVSKMHGHAGAVAGQVTGRKSWEKYCRLLPPSGSSGCYFQCVRCPHVGPDIWHLKRHFLSTHSGTHAYSCRVCRYSTGDVHRLIGHMTGHGELFCHRCSFSTVELERFKEHLTTCTGEGPLDSVNSQCPVCGDHFDDNQVVKQHVSEMHQRDYCEHCACVIYGPESIEDHLLQHQTELNMTTNVASSSDGHIQEFADTASGENHGTAKDAEQNHGAVARDTSKEAFEMTEEAVRQSRYRFGRFSNQTYYCPVQGCAFKATWKKSIELHTLNYHTDTSVDDHPESVTVVLPSPPDPASATAPVAISGLFNCPFCPNCRTFKYRKSYEKHLLQHGVDYTKHPYLVIRSSQKEDSTAQNSFL